MGLESTTTIAGLVSTNPVASDAVGQADDHLRLIKSVLKTTFPGSGGAGFTIPITASEAELNYVDGVTSAIQTQLNTHTTNIGTAQTTANTGVANAATAQSTANTGVSNAATAQSTANTALANAATADAKAVVAQAMGADAWANLNGSTGAVVKGYNVAGVSKPAGNQYDITFTNAMPNAEYAVLGCSTDSGTVFYVAGTLTVNGFRLQTTAASPTRVSFAVFAVA